MKKIGVLLLAIFLVVMGTAITYAQNNNSGKNIATSKVDKKKQPWPPHYVQLFDGVLFDASQLKWDKLSAKEQVISVTYILPTKDTRTYILKTKYKFDLLKHKCWVKNVSNVVFDSSFWENRGMKVGIEDEEKALLQDKSPWLESKKQYGMGAEHWVELPNDNLYAGFAYYMMNHENWSDNGWNWSTYFADKKAL